MRRKIKKAEKEERAGRGGATRTSEEIEEELEKPMAGAASGKVTRPQRGPVKTPRRLRGKLGFIRTRIASLATASVTGP